MAEPVGRERGKLLVIDDDLCLREAAGMFLNANGYACTTSENAIAALASLERERFDLIVTDLHMPDMDGMALLEWIKTRWPKTRVIIMTGDADVGIQRQALENGADCYLMKPFTLDRFLREIESCLTNHRPALEINPDVFTSRAVSCKSVPPRKAI